MIRLRGECASRGIALGPAYPLEMKLEIPDAFVGEGERAGEQAQLDEAIATTSAQLDRLSQLIHGAQAVHGRDLIEVHRMMLYSSDLTVEAGRRIASDGLTAAAAVARTIEHIRTVFMGMEDDFFRERGVDFEVIGERLLRTLVGLPELHPGDHAPKGGIAAGVSLSPLDLFSLRRAGIAGLVSEGGGLTSHAAIMARAFGLPYIVGVDGLSNEIHAGSVIVVDGTRGDVIIDPDEETVRLYESRMGEFAQRQQALHSSKALPAVTTDGVRVHLAANVESVAGIAAALAAGAESIGLFRTEFLYLDRPDLPSEDEQYADAVSALRSAGGIPVTFRALDMGGDKVPRVVKLPTGPNPALGVRSIRFLLERPEILRSQLRALYRAASTGPLRVMFPMISGVTELSRVWAIRDGVLADLARDGIAHNGEAATGIMIETPSAAHTADHLANRCDFLSVGTNDLLQYTFAADRENDDVAHLYQPLHPAVLRTLKLLVDMATHARTPIAICGDMAGDPFLTWILLGLGYRELSMDPDRIPLVKALVRGTSLAHAEDLAHRALASESEVDTIALVREALDGQFPNELEGFVPLDAQVA